MNIWELIALAKAGNGGTKSMLRFKGSVLTESALPESGNDGDTYLVDSADSYFAWDGEGWTDVGQLLSMDDVAALFDQVEDAGDQQVARIVAKGQEVEKSIPEDYSELSGDVDELKSAINNTFTWHDGGFIDPTYGTISSHQDYHYTDYIEINTISIPLVFRLRVFSNIATYAVYDKDKTFIRSHSVESSTSIWETGTVQITDENEKYIRFSSSRLSGEDYVINANYFDIDIKNGGIDNRKLSEKSVLIKNVSNDILVFDTNTNYIDYSKITAGNYITYKGTVRPSSNVNATDFIPLVGGEVYYFNNVFNTYYAFYDSNKEFITGESYSTLGDLTNPFTVPSDASYGRFTILDANYTAQDAWINRKNEKPEKYHLTLNNNNIFCYPGNGQPCDYTGNDIVAFSKCLCVGDSLTAGVFNNNNGSPEYVSYDKYSYPDNLKRMTGLEVSNEGVGGLSSGEWYTRYENTDLSGYDIALIQLGVNDQIRRDSLGMSLAEWFADNTRCGFSNIITKLKTENKNIKIFVSNIIPARSYSTPGYLEFSDYLLNWIKTTYSNDPNVIPVDLQQYGHTKNTTAYNCGHLSAYGYWRLAKDWMAYVGWYMNNNKDQFREIQFIGTDYWYTNPNP